MAASASFVPGTIVWVEDDSAAWVEAEIVSVQGDKVTVKKQDKEVTVKLSKCHPKDLDAPDGGVDDMTKLAYLHEPGVLDNLSKRYSLDEIYTYTGNILIAVNPFAKLANMYDARMMDMYKGVRLGELSPHVFAIAECAFRAMVDYNTSQSILVSGESGAGKTETTKLIMQYLAHMGGRAASDGRTVEQQVLESNPLLEAFGNAKTVRNNNSSRFGKFVEIQFDSYGRISGAAVRTYLLERSRVVQITDPERNYHCFYQLCAGAGPEEAKRLKLQPAETFHYLNQSQCFELPGKENNADEYINTRRAMDIVGLSPEEQDSIFRVVAAILHLGNINFKPGSETDSSETADSQSDFHLTTVAELLMCDEQLLRDSLTSRTIVTRDGNIMRALDPEAAVVSRDTLAKTVYARLFDWLVSKVNSSIGQDPTSKTIIGVLDIYGFESFKVNSFEQFCINLANEKLQQHFNQHVFKSEQEEYEREKINWSYIEFVDNQDVLELIEKKPMGIIALLDEQCMFPKSSPETFATKLFQILGRHKRLTKPRLSQVDFIVDHYAGEVMYQTELFLDKNKDFVVMEHQTLLSNSKNAFVAGMFPPSTGEKAKSKFVSLGSTFKQQLAELMTTLSTTEPHYIRCIKPNGMNKPGMFQNGSVLQQLRCGGVLEAVRISCAGYPTRRTFDEFLDRFGFLAPEIWDGSVEDKVAVTKLLEKFGFSNFQVGISKVFLRAGQMPELDALRTEKLSEAARIIQHGIRAHLQRKAFVRLRLGVIKAQAVWRGIRARRAFDSFRKRVAATRIQKHARRMVAQQRFKAAKNATILVQAGVRGMNGRKLYREKRRNKAATCIQTYWRRYHQRAAFNRLRHSSIVFQSAWRSRGARLELKQLKHDAKQTGALQEAKTKLEKQCEELTWRLHLEKRMRLDIEESKAQEIAKLQSSLEEAEKLVEEVKGEKEQLAQQLAERPPTVVVKKEPSSPVLTAVYSPAPPSPLGSPVQKPVPHLHSHHQTVRVVEVPMVSESGETSVMEHHVQELTLENTKLKASLEEYDSKAAELEGQLAFVKEELQKSKEEVERLTDMNAQLEESLRSMEQENKVFRRQSLSVLASAQKAGGAGRLPGHMFGRQLENINGLPSPTAADGATVAAAGDGAVHTTPGPGAEGDVARRQKQLVDRQQADLDTLLKSLVTDIGFDHDRPLAACLLYKSLMHWRSFEMDRTTVFDRILQTIGSAVEGQDSNEKLAYWLANTTCLLSLLQRSLKASGAGGASQRRRSAPPTSLLGRMAQSFRGSPTQVAPVGGTPAPSSAGSGSHSLDVVRQVDAKYPALLFKQQLTAFVEKIYGMIRDNLKKDISPMLASCIQAPRGSRTTHGRHARTSPGNNSGAASSPTAPNQQLSSHWAAIIGALSKLLDTLRGNHVPPFLAQKLFTQIFSFINVQLFNSLLLRRECCSFSNGEYVKAGLGELENWILESKEEYFGSAFEELRFIRQAVGFLVIHQKTKKSLADITMDLCPVLSVQQLYRISTMYYDDKYGTHSVSPEVISAMRSKMTEESSTNSNNSFLLDDDSSIPFSVDDVCKSVPEVDLHNLHPPPTLKENASFAFLLMSRD